MRIFYYIYMFCIAVPLGITATIIAALTTIAGCAVGNGHFWGYYPGKYWSRAICTLFLIPVKVYGRENIDKHSSYVFVANHQGAFDIFLIYGYLNRNFKWMMKQSLRKIPFVGKACPLWREHLLWYSPKGRGHLRATWDISRKEHSNWPMNCSCLSYR